MQGAPRKMLDAFNFKKEIGNLHNLEGSTVMVYRPKQDVQAYRVGIVKSYKLDTSAPEMILLLSPCLGYHKEPSDEELSKAFEFFEFSKKQDMSYEPHEIEFSTRNLSAYIAVLR